MEAAILCSFLGMLFFSVSRSLKRYEFRDGKETVVKKG